MDSSQICNHDKCTGCGACYNKCPKNCIKMKEDNLGFLYPVIEEDKCIHCNACRRVCPVNTPRKKRKIKDTFAAWDLDINSRKSSMSGGAAAVFSKYVIKNGGTVFGASWNDDFTVSHIEVQDEAELDKLKGSKYVQSNIGNIYESVEKTVKSGKMTLFIGTPCQCAGLMNFISDSYDNLYVVDIICHGVPSQKLLNDAVKEAIGEKEYTQILFRDRTGYKLQIYNKDNLLYAKSYKEVSYARAFLYGLHSRKSCYSCEYAEPKRVTDITIGDFWGLGVVEKFEHSKEDGVSVILVNSDKGSDLLDKCKEKMFLEKRQTEEAVNGNSQLQGPHQKHPKCSYFNSNYEEGKYYSVLKKCFRTELIVVHVKDFAKKVLRKGR